MRKSRFTDEQIVAILWEADRTSVAEAWQVLRKRAQIREPDVTQDQRKPVGFAHRHDDELDREGAVREHTDRRGPGSDKGRGDVPKT